MRFHDLLRVEALVQNSRQRALPNPYRAFDSDVARQLKKIGHGLPERGFRENQDSFAAYIASRHEAIVERVNRGKF